MAKKTRGRQAGGRNARSAAKHLLPRLALWAGVGIFVCALCMGCDDDEGPAAPLPDDRYVWAAPEYCHFDLLKVGNNTGSVVQTLDLNEEAYACLGMAVGPESGNVYVFLNERLKKYDRYGELVYSVDMGWEDDFQVDEGHDALWTYDWVYLSLWSAASGEQVGPSIVYEPDAVLAFRASAYDGGVWIAGTSDQKPRNRIVKYTKGLEEERTIALERPPEYLDVNGENGDVWVTWSKKNEAEGKNWYVSRYSRDGYYYGDVVVEDMVWGITVNEYTGGCFIKFRDGVTEYSAGGELVGRWSIPDLTGLAADPATGDLYATNYVKRTGPILYKIDGGLKRIVWRADLGYTAGKYLGCCPQ